MAPFFVVLIDTFVLTINRFAAGVFSSGGLGAFFSSDASVLVAPSAVPMDTWNDLCSLRRTIIGGKVQQRESRTFWVIFTPA